MPSAPPSPQHGERCACCAQLNTATTTGTFSGGCYDDKGAFSGGCYDEKGDKIVAGYNAEMASLQAKMTLLQAEKASLLAEKASLKAEIAQCAEDKTNASTSNCPAGCVSVNATQRGRRAASLRRLPALVMLTSGRMPWEDGVSSGQCAGCVR